MNCVTITDVCTLLFQHATECATLPSSSPCGFIIYNDIITIRSCTSIRGTERGCGTLTTQPLTAYQTSSSLSEGRPRTHGNGDESNPLSLCQQTIGKCNCHQPCPPTLHSTPQNHSRIPNAWIHIVRGSGRV